MHAYNYFCSCPTLISCDMRVVNSRVVRLISGINAELSGGNHTTPPNPIAMC